MISLILLKLFTFSQILQGVPKLLHATVSSLDAPLERNASLRITSANKSF